MRSIRSLKSTHWVMWSSPLLLLVLVFTLTSTPSRATSQSSSRTTPTSSTTTSLVSAPTTTTTTSKKASTRPKSRLTVNVKPTATHRVTLTRHPTSTSASKSVSSSSVTGSSVTSIASASAENSASGALSGQLSARFGVAVVPLDGPGTWTVASSAPIGVSLSCQGSSVDVQTQFEIGAHEECQVTITPSSATTSLTWQLTPST